MKKFLAIILSLLIICVVFCSCGEESKFDGKYEIEDLQTYVDSYSGTYKENSSFTLEINGETFSSLMKNGENKVQLEGDVVVISDNRILLRPTKILNYENNKTYEDEPTENDELYLVYEDGKLVNQELNLSFIKKSRGS